MNSELILQLMVNKKAAEQINGCIIGKLVFT